MYCSVQVYLRKLWLLVCACYWSRVVQAVLGVELDSDGVVCCAAVEATALDAGHVGHDFELGVEG